MSSGSTKTLIHDLVTFDPSVQRSTAVEKWLKLNDADPHFLFRFINRKKHKMQWQNSHRNSELSHFYQEKVI